jgi:hypothetical protein
VPKRTQFATVPIASIRHLMDASETPEPKKEAEVCLNCGHLLGDHNLESDTCWHAITQNSKVTMCKCDRWQPGWTSRPRAGPAELAS